MKFFPETVSLKQAFLIRDDEHLVNSAGAGLL